MTDNGFSVQVHAAVKEKDYDSVRIPCGMGAAMF
jgi:hypothetical protein